MKKQKRKLNEIEGCKKDQLSHISLLLDFTAMTHLELRKIPKWPGMDTKLLKIEPKILAGQYFLWNEHFN